MTDWLTKLTALRAKPERIVLGVMSGTSVDSIDGAICRIRGASPISHGAAPSAQVDLIELMSVPYRHELRDRILKGGAYSLREVAELHSALGEMFGELCFRASKRAGELGLAIDLVGCHGQTVYHHSRQPGAARVSLQLGDGDRIAEAIRLPVFFDFRARDLATGGEGAPLTPYADRVLFGGVPGRVVLNLGGIANITVLADDPGAIIGFDTGPANAPLDRLARKLTSGAQQHDVDGALARQGTVRRDLLEQLLREDRFLAEPPPKSTGFETYGDAFVERLVALHGGLSCDVLATATEFVARSIADAVKRFGGSAVREIIVAGGGGKNPFLIERLTHVVAPLALRHSDELGVPGSAREAMAFALFANDALCGHATSLPSVTGAREARILGKLALP